MHADEAGAHDDQHADEADEDRDQPPPADPLAEQRPREQRHHERRQEDDGDRLVEAQVLEGQEVERGRRDHEQRAHELQLEAVRGEQSADAHHAEERERTSSRSTNCPMKRAQTISEMGSPFRVARYLAAVSRPEKSPTASDHEADRLEAVGGRVWRHVDRVCVDIGALGEDAGRCSPGGPVLEAGRDAPHSPGRGKW